ncbi:excalibur calcium-binding domain-containing protein [Chitinimonas koreensis]|uniref:excalibur calcium-binding domain-containing protein n=1 Tax=Chitinimonas koreensis TaxID=356302 RepID=UPI0003FB5306|nr:excalibur calcium-binding domain-containing protein [Chitinimonas koreensis]QNM98078.1 excalibur calcium-binding domain-containing protein [Chitinimonas koreensis]
MKRLVVLAILALIVWQGYSSYKARQAAKLQAAAVSRAFDTFAPEPAAAPVRIERAPAAQFSCDGRTHCSQMRSCEEATFFLRNCPGPEMDGDNDGIPCEKQWCGPSS